MHPKWLHFRYKLFSFRPRIIELAREQVLAQRPQQARLLDLGCGDGEYLLRFRDLWLHPVGLELSFPRLQQARQHVLDVAQASGTELPFPDDAFDMITVFHVLHHVADYGRVLSEMQRCLAPDGVIFMIETTTDHPLLRLGRQIHPVWQGDEVEVNWRFDELTTILQAGGFRVAENGRFNHLFFLWEMLPLAFWPLELFTPIFIYLDLLLAKLFPQKGAHCYFVLKQNRELSGS